MSLNIDIEIVQLIIHQSMWRKLVREELVEYFLKNTGVKHVLKDRYINSIVDNTSVYVEEDCLGRTCRILPENIDSETCL